MFFILSRLETFSSNTSRVARAIAAAYSDSRFPPVNSSEISQLDIHISILGTPEEITFDSENDLLNRLYIERKTGERRQPSLPDC